MPRSRRLSTPLVAFGASLALLVSTAASCGGDDDPSDRPQPTTTAIPTTQSQEQEDEQSLRQLASDWFEEVRQVYMRGTGTEGLAAFAEEPYLSGVIGQIEEFRATGNMAQESDETRHEVVSVDVDGSEAVLVECVVDADVVIAASGEVVNDDVQANLYETEARKVDEGWRLTGRKTLREVDGSDQCPDL